MADPDSVWDRACAAVIRDGSIVMVHCDHGTHSHWTLPGGGIEPGETPAQAALRELREEAGLSGADPRFLFQRPWGPGGTKTETCFLVTVSNDQIPVLGCDPELDDGNQQLIAVAWRPLTELRDDIQISRVMEALSA